MFWIFSAVSASPKLSDLPGHSVVQKLLDGTLAGVLALSLFGVLVGAGMMWVGHHTTNSHAAHRGRQTAMMALVGAIAAGGGPGLVNFFTTLGRSIH